MKPDFIELAYEFPTSLRMQRQEDYFEFPLRIAKEMDLTPSVYSMRTYIRREKWEIVDGFQVRRFHDPHHLLLSAVIKKPLLIHGHSFGWIPSSVAPLLWRNYVFTPHIYRLDVYNTALVKLVTKLVSRSKALIALTNFEATWFSPHMDETRIHVVPHPIDFRFFSRAKTKDENEFRERLGVEKVVLAVANITPRKNFETLIKAFKFVRDAIPRSKLIIAGATPPTTLGVWRSGKSSDWYFHELEELVSLLHLERDVTFTGFQNAEQLRVLYAAADVFALPSRIEGQLIAASEAAASGLPLVLSNLEPLLEIYKGCALFHPPNDVNCLADLIIRVLTDDKLAKKLGKSGQQRMRIYDIPVIKSKLKAVYESCIS